MFFGFCGKRVHLRHGNPLTHHMDGLLVKWRCFNNYLREHAEFVYGSLSLLNSSSSRSSSLLTVQVMPFVATRIAPLWSAQNSRPPLLSRAKGTALMKNLSREPTGEGASYAKRYPEYSPVNTGSVA